MEQTPSLNEIRKFEIRNPKFLCGSDVAGNMRVFQTRFESSNLSSRSRFGVRRPGAAFKQPERPIKSTLKNQYQSGARPPHSKGARRQVGQRHWAANPLIVSSNLTARSKKLSDMRPSCPLTLASCPLDSYVLVNLITTS